MPQSHNRWKYICYTYVFSILLTIAFSTIAFSWGSLGHKIVNGKAVMQLPSSMASFKLDSIYFVNNASDADFRKNYSDTSFYAEYLRHYIDIDTYPDYLHIPHRLDSIIQRFGRDSVRNTGTLPWAIVMVMDSLTAQLRRGAIVLAESTMADLGHYVGDAHQPLHNTENFDGGMTGNNGIHSRYETTLITKFQTSIVVNLDSAKYIASPLEYAFEFIYHSNSLVDSVLAADSYAKTATGWSGSGSAPAAYYDSMWVKDARFTKDQFQRASVALASLWYTAWVNSQSFSSDTIYTQSFGGGNINPSGSVIVQSGADKKFSFVIPVGYHVDSVSVDGSKVDSLSGYTFHSVTANHTLNVWFSINHYTISAGANVHGTVIPSGDILLAYDSTQSFLIVPDSGYVVDSLFIDGSYVDSTSRYTFVDVHQHHSLMATFKPLPVSVQCSVMADWNMVSIPLNVTNPLKIVIFPNALSPAFDFNNGYQAKDSLVTGRGYWIKFASAHIVAISGSLLDIDTVAVKAGWNMIGSISDTVNLSCVVPLATTIQSQFFGYQNGYVASDVILPGNAYWVKVSSDGSLILQHNCTVIKN